MFGLLNRKDKDQVIALTTQVQELQHSHSILLNNLEQVERQGTYRSYSMIVEELNNKYECRARWGNQQCQNIVNIRSAFIIGSGISVSGVRDTATRELAFIKEFIKDNNLDNEIPQEWAKEAELEGKALLKVFVDKTGKKIKCQILPWVKYRYKAHTNGDDYTDIVRVTFDKDGSRDATSLEPQSFVFGKFGGRIAEVNDTTPVIGVVLKQMEDIDRGITDWRKINHLFATPTPYFKTETADEARKLHQVLKDLRWTIGNTLVTNAEFHMTGITDQGIVSLEKEIQNNVKMVSGATGVPVHFLGLPDIMSNRATADNLMELILTSTSRSHNTWIGIYKELMHKVLELANSELQMGFDVNALTVDIPMATSTKMAELVSIWLPLYSAGTITLKTFLNQVPGINAQQENLDVKEEQSKISKSSDVRSVINASNAGNTNSDFGNGQNANPKKPAASRSAA